MVHTPSPAARRMPITRLRSLRRDLAMICQFSQNSERISPEYTPEQGGLFLPLSTSFAQGSAEAVGVDRNVAVARRTPSDGREQPPVAATRYEQQPLGSQPTNGGEEGDNFSGTTSGARRRVSMHLRQRAELPRRLRPAEVDQQKIGLSPASSTSRQVSVARILHRRRTGDDQRQRRRPTVRHAVAEARRPRAKIDSESHDRTRPPICWQRSWRLRAMVPNRRAIFAQFAGHNPVG